MWNQMIYILGDVSRNVYALTFVNLFAILGEDLGRARICNADDQ